MGSGGWAGRAPGPCRAGGTWALGSRRNLGAATTGRRSAPFAASSVRPPHSHSAEQTAACTWVCSQGINTRCKRELEAIAAQYPFQPLEYLPKTLRLTFKEGIQMLHDAGIEVSSASGPAAPPRRLCSPRPLCTAAGIVAGIANVSAALMRRPRRPAAHRPIRLATSTPSWSASWASLSRTSTRQVGEVQRGQHSTRYSRAQRSAVRRHVPSEGGLGPTVVCAPLALPSDPASRLALPSDPASRPSRRLLHAAPLPAGRAPFLHHALQGRRQLLQLLRHLHPRRGDHLRGAGQHLGRAGQVGWAW